MSPHSTLSAVLLAGLALWASFAPECAAQSASDVPQARCLWSEVGVGDALAGLVRPRDRVAHATARDAFRRHALLHGQGALIADPIRLPADRLVGCDPIVLDLLFVYSIDVEPPEKLWLAQLAACVLERSGRGEQALQVLDAVLRRSGSAGGLSASVRRDVAALALRSGQWDFALAHLDAPRPGRNASLMCGMAEASTASALGHDRLRCYLELGRWAQLSEQIEAWSAKGVAWDDCYLEYLIESYHRRGDARGLEEELSAFVLRGRAEAVESALRHRRVLASTPVEDLPAFLELLAEGEHWNEVVARIRAANPAHLVPEALNRVRHTALEDERAAVDSLWGLVPLGDPRIGRLIEELSGVLSDDHARYRLERVTEDWARTQRLYAILRGEVEIDPARDL